ncbi:unnamed protein product, partial [Nesidiocoris tenuis]
MAVHQSDSVQIYDGTTTSGLRLHPGDGFTGNQVPRITLTASSGDMLVRFTTDALHNAKGWHATYSAGKRLINKVDAHTLANQIDWIGYTTYCTVIYRLPSAAP